MTARAVNTPPNPSTFSTYVTCKDHLVSGEEFDLLLDENLDLLMTSPKPEISDLGKYYQSDAYISHTDSSNTLVDKVYQIVKNYALKKKLALLTSFNSEQKKVLDIGCGTGDFLKICADNGWDVTGVEPSEVAQSLVRSKISSEKLSLFDSVDALKKQDNVFLSFDVITLWHVLEHVPNLDETIFNLKKLLKPEGTIVIAVPNFKSDDANYYKKYWAAYDVPRHLWHFSQTALRRLFFFQAMEVVKTLPMVFDAYYVSLLSEKNIAGTTNYFRAFWRGFVSNWKAKSSHEYSSLIYVIKNIKNWF